ncbi:MAG: hypothetical protein KDM81_16485, partial [Verrucomicrobiae bacterium]|nr:hypothetical protein [Verrucomicrobiae bacterium]
QEMVDFNGQLYFAADTAAAGWELWRTNGITTGIVADIDPGADDAYPQNLVAMNGHLYFSANNGATGNELFRTDGANPVANTELVADINPGSWGSDPNYMTQLGSYLYFRAGTEASGNELWRTNGTEVVMLGDIYPGEEDSNPSQLTKFGDAVYFAAEDEGHGFELWKTSGGAPKLVRDILPGDGSGDPYDFTSFGQSLYFSADDGTHGWEIWRITEDSKVHAKLQNRKLKLNRAGQTTLRLRCQVAEISGPCTGNLVLRTNGGLVAARGKFTVNAGETGAITVKLSKRARKALRKASGAPRLKAVVKARDLAGNKRTLTRGLRISGPGVR